MSQPAVDRDKVIQLLDGNPDLILTIIDSFLSDCPEYMDKIRAAVEGRDAETLMQEAHGLKGAAGSLRAEPTSNAAATLEEIGHSGEFENADDALETLETEVDRLKEALTTLREECQQETDIQ